MGFELRSQASILYAKQMHANTFGLPSDQNPTISDKRIQESA